MSILKQVLSDAWSSLGKRPAVEKPTSVHAGIEQAPSNRLASPSGMKAVILNWKMGENDPFTVFNNTIKKHLHACGKNVELIEITDVRWPDRLADLAPTGVDFAFTWQGLGSNVMFGGGNDLLWEQLKIPLICVHGDHPSHMPRNHQVENPYCFHLYTNADSARYSNRHFRSRRSASVIDIPKLHCESPIELRTGDHFVIAKNINDPTATEAFWRDRMDRPAFEAHMVAVEALKARVQSEPYVDIHDVLDALIDECGWLWLRSTVNPGLYHEFHSKLDHYIRSYKTVLAVTALREFPMRIFGRGWEKISETASSHHAFAPAQQMADSQHLYYSTYGLVDISPSAGLHDRTRRAMANGRGFLSSAYLVDSFVGLNRFDSLFFSFKASDLADKAARIMQDPQTHHFNAEQFAEQYDRNYHFKDFVGRIDCLAKSVHPSWQ